MVECPISYACQFKSPLGPLSVGGSFKLLAGTTYNGQAKIDTESGDISDELDHADQTSNTYSYDAGVLWQPQGCNNLAIGAVGKYLNSPKFDIANSNAKYTVEPMWRAGIAYSCLQNRLDFAADYDLTTNTLDDGNASQYLGGGLNYHPTSWLSLRAGAMQNLANNDELGTIGTAGIGIGLKWVQFDISAQMSAKKGYYDGKETPRYARLNAALVSRW